MNSKRAFWTWFCRVVIIMTVLTTPLLQAADNTNTNSAEVLPLTKVSDYMSACRTNTSLQNRRAAVELMGKFYRGVIVVGNVLQGSETIQIQSSFGNVGYQMTFSVKDAQLQAKAAELRRGDTVMITARLKDIGENAAPNFNDVQSLEVNVKNQTEPKK